jgi:phage regulator Rha-like protein
MENNRASTGLIVVCVDDEMCIDSRLIAVKLGIEHEVFMRTVRKYQPQMESLGVIRFKSGKPIKGSRGGRPEQYAMLNEDQCVFAATLSRNSSQVVEFKLALTVAFRDARTLSTGQSASVQIPFLNTLWTRRALIFNEKTLIPEGYWCVFNEIGHICWQMELKDIHLTAEATPDISVGQLWCKHIRHLGLDMSLVKKYDHHYPPNDKRKIQQANIYPNAWYGHFRDWFQRQYLKVEFKKYLATHMIANGELPASKPKQIENLPISWQS